MSIQDTSLEFGLDNLFIEIIGFLEITGCRSLLLANAYIPCFIDTFPMSSHRLVFEQTDHVTGVLKITAVRSSAQSGGAGETDEDLPMAPIAALAYPAPVGSQSLASDRTGV